MVVPSKNEAEAIPVPSFTYLVGFALHGSIRIILNVVGIVPILPSLLFLTAFAVILTMYVPASE